MAKYHVTAPDGTKYEVSAPDGASPEMVDGVLKGVIAQHKQRGGGGLLDTLKSGYETIRQIGGAIDPMGEFVTSRMAGEKPRLESNAFLLRTAPGLIPNPWLSGGGAAIGETGAQEAEMLMGERKEYDPLQIGIAGAIPPVVAGAARVARGIGRTATRLSPSLFRSAHDKAIGAADELVQGLRPDVDPGQLFKAARQAGAEAVPASKTAAVLTDLNRSLPTNPASPALKVVREHMDNIGKAVQDGAMSLDSLMQLRRDLGASLGRAPEMKALYKGLIGDLETAATSGGPGASMAKEALTAFKRDLGASKIADFVESAKMNKAVWGSDTPALNMAKLSKTIGTNREELTKLLGADGMQLVGALLQRFRTLPPDVAYNGVGRAIGALFGVGGVVSGQMPTAVAGAAGLELLANAWFVGKNPAALNQFLTTAVQAARASTMAPQTEEP